MNRFSALSGSFLRMIPRLGALAMVVATATISVGCVAEEVDEPAEVDTEEEPGAAEQAISIRCHVCSPGTCEPGVFCSTDCYTDYCTAGQEYCDSEVGCVPYP
jgi:hypothetical protein